LPSTTAAAALDFTPTPAVLDAVIAQIARDGDRSGSAVDETARRAAFARYLALPVHGNFGRAWRYDYAKLAYDELHWSSDRVSLPTLPHAAGDDVAGPALATENAGGLVHFGATLVERAQRSTLDPRVLVMSLADAKRAHPELVARAHGRIADTQTDRFVALATAFQNCGAFVYVPDGVVLDAPLQLLFTNAGEDAPAVFPHIVIVLGAGARATVIERWSGAGDAFICGTVEVHAGANAQCDVVTIQQAGDEARAFFTRAARTERDATVRWQLAELGGALARTIVDNRLAEPGSRGATAALFFTGGMQHVDLTTQSDHAVGQTTSETVVRSAATDRGQGRFFGNIVIRAHAHGSDASLRDDTLLLSQHANIDSVPALEIAANDVKAFHGATVGSVDEEQLFYARSRGIARADALRMVALGFFEPVIARFPGEQLRDEIRTALDAKIDEATELDV
jgi:Fe-S cluster assembly protein SufD